MDFVFYIFLEIFNILKLVKNSKIALINQDDIELCNGITVINVSNMIFLFNERKYSFSS